MEAIGRTPTTDLGGAGSLGSGCAPGTADLPDGVWFGWIEATASDSISFDLACLWPGRSRPAASNDKTKVREVATSAATAVYLGAAEPVSYSAWGGAAAASVNAPGLPETRPFWIFVNDAVITEMAEYPEAIDWRLTTSAWPGLVPGCCEGGTVAPASPTDPWPAQGWPSDGFYSTTATVRDGQIDVTLRKWLSCSQHPDMCAPWWTGDEVTTDPDAPTLQQSIPFDQELTVVILPILSDRAIVGDGHALETLLNDLNTAIEIWMTDSGYDELLELSEDPSFPFGGPASDALLGGDQMGYRGPGGMHLTPYGDTASLPGWTTLEVRDGRPILYIHAGIIAG